MASSVSSSVEFFFFQAEDGIRDVAVTGVQTCALPVFAAVGTKVGASTRGGLGRDDADDLFARIRVANRGLGNPPQLLGQRHAARIDFAGGRGRRTNKGARALRPARPDLRAVRPVALARTRPALAQVPRLSDRGRTRRRGP